MEVCAKTLQNINFSTFSGILFAFQYLVKNIDWLDENIQKHRGSYFIFDFPGQVELYTHDEDIATLCEHLDKVFSFRVCLRHSFLISFIFSFS